MGQDIGLLAQRIQLYRENRANHGFPAHTGTVSLMLHTFVGDDLDDVYEIVREPLREYLRSAISLERVAAATGGSISGGKVLTDTQAAQSDEDELLDIAFERYFNTSALMGTVDTCQQFVQTLEEIGVDEIACLVDFGVDHGLVRRSLESLARLTAQSRTAAMN